MYRRWKIRFLSTLQMHPSLRGVFNSFDECNVFTSSKLLAFLMFQANLQIDFEDRVQIPPKRL
jgi:hypothetical protein